MYNIYNICLTYLLSRCSRIDSPEDDYKDEKEYCNEHKVSDEGSIYLERVVTAGRGWVKRSGYN